MDRPPRRVALGWLAAAAASPSAAAPAAPAYPAVRPGVRLQFPRDHGAHPDYRIEWWYVTGWVAVGREQLGFQVTFFRSRPGVDEANPSAFAARQVLFAHAALSDPAAARLLHDQRAAREGFGLAGASTRDADVRIDGWRFWREAGGRFRTRVQAADFALDLAFMPTQGILLQGDAGYSRKGPSPGQASAYYSLPQLAVSGTVSRGRRARQARGRAWLDREWSSTLLDPRAVGWDWTGLNLDDGGAVMAFQVRDAAGGALWAGATLRGPDGATTRFGPGEVKLTRLRAWRSPRTGALYPVEQLLTLAKDGVTRRWRLKPLFDDQELDSRRAAGPVYWEGAVTTGEGRGYLELTGYAQPLRM